MNHLNYLIKNDASYAVLTDAAKVVFLETYIEGSAHKKTTVEDIAATIQANPIGFVPTRLIKLIESSVQS